MVKHHCFVQDVSDQYSLRYPSLYKPGQKNLLFNRRRFFLCTLQGLTTSCLLFFIPYGAFAIMEKEDGTQISDQQTFAVTVATSLILVVSVEVQNVFFFLKKPFMVVQMRLCMCVVFRLGLRSTTGQSSISCSCGEASPCTSPFCSRCTATGCLG